MLVLTRKKDESLVIGDHIVLTVLAIEGDKVKLGIDAPREVSILRHELWAALNEQASIAERMAGGDTPSRFDDLRKFLASEAPAAEAAAAEAAESDAPAAENPPPDPKDEDETPAA